jgi:cell wall-associated NlpC family hydrolase
MNKYQYLWLVLMLSACQSPRLSETNSHSDAALNDLALYALSLSGTPYKYGGTSPDVGFDCSGFVGHVFKHTLGKSLPRSSSEISQIGIKQRADNLQPGDLVFYNTLHKSYSHVGIYLGDGQFIHSPSSGKSVSIVNMNEPYWEQRYNGARRIMP